MANRPPDLFPLFASTQELAGIGPKSAKLLQKSGLSGVIDLALLLPAAVQDRRPSPSLAGLPLPRIVTVEATSISHHFSAKQSARPHIVVMKDSKTTFKLAFFQSTPKAIEQRLPLGERRLISGRAEFFDGQIQITHPDYILDPTEAASLPPFEPIYPLTGGIRLKTMQKAVRNALARVPDFDEWADPHLVQKENWPSFLSALKQMHAPSSEAAMSPLAAARRRLAYDEIFAHQLTLAVLRSQKRQIGGRSSLSTGRILSVLRDNLPFSLTGAQSRVIDEIATDLASENRMNRLLQGDVGAGKTLVALMALAIVVEAGGQGALMAPTEILARQHLAGLQQLAAGTGLRIAGLTGRDKGAARRELLDRLSKGEIDILVGTHALFQQDVDFKDLRLAIIDEQHRFGVRQRMALGAKGAAADVLIMTATPIPRSLALVGFGDMDVSILDEKPPGRSPISTVLISQNRRGEVIDRLKNAVKEGAKAFWVCPLVNESETIVAASAEALFQTLRGEFEEGDVGLVHGQMEPAQKDKVMAAFVAGDVKVLVSTTVIEVGVDVPNASIMVIEGAETFGLSQIHQLRGRVGRGRKKSTCLLLYAPDLSETAKTRLHLLRDSEDGFFLAEADLKIRGAGDMIGTAQSGTPRFRIADLDHHGDLLKVAREDSRNLIGQDPSLETPRGQAARRLLWIMRQDQGIRFFDTG